MKVTLINHTPEPLRTLYTAFRTCYSPLTAETIWNEALSLEAGAIIRYIEARLGEGHTSPLEHLSFSFAVDEISRSCSHQLVRHRVGISFSQQSQRYVAIESHAGFVVPNSVGDGSETFDQAIDDALYGYHQLVGTGVPAEDARYLLPESTPTNLVVTVNLAELLHIGDQRLCTRAQWEIRHLVAGMRREVMRIEPLLGRMMGPPCLPQRLGYCPESERAWSHCPIGRRRPHKHQILALWEAAQRGVTEPFSDHELEEAIDAGTTA